MWFEEAWSTMKQVAGSERYIHVIRLDNPLEIESQYNIVRGPPVHDSVASDIWSMESLLDGVSLCPASPEDLVDDGQLYLQDSFMSFKQATMFLRNMVLSEQETYSRVKLVKYNQEELSSNVADMRDLVDDQYLTGIHSKQAAEQYRAAANRSVSGWDDERYVDSGTAIDDTQRLGPYTSADRARYLD